MGVRNFFEKNIPLIGSIMESSRKKRELKQQREILDEAISLEKMGIMIDGKNPENEYNKLLGKVQEIENKHIEKMKAYEDSLANEQKIKLDIKQKKSELAAIYKIRMPIPLTLLTGFFGGIPLALGLNAIAYGIRKISYGATKAFSITKNLPFGLGKGGEKAYEICQKIKHIEKLESDIKTEKANRNAFLRDEKRYPEELKNAVLAVKAYESKIKAKTVQMEKNAPIIKKVSENYHSIQQYYIKKAQARAYKEIEAKSVRENWDQDKIDVERFKKSSEESEIAKKRFDQQLEYLRSGVDMDENAPIPGFLEDLNEIEAIKESNSNVEANNNQPNDQSTRNRFTLFRRRDKINTQKHPSGQNVATHYIEYAKEELQQEFMDSYLTAWNEEYGLTEPEVEKCIGKAIDIIKENNGTLGWEKDMEKKTIVLNKKIADVPEVNQKIFSLAIAIHRRKEEEKKLESRDMAV